MYCVRYETPSENVVFAIAQSSVGPFWCPGVGGELPVDSSESD